MKVAIDKEIYRAVVPENTSLYQRPEWLDVVCPDWDAYIGLDSSGDPAWLFPFYQKSKWGIRKLGRPNFSADNGVILLKPSVEFKSIAKISPLFSVMSTLR